MKRTLVAIFLFAFSLKAFADIDTTALGEQEKQMVLQSSKIILEFEKHKIKTDGEFYQNIWMEEFNVVDYIEVAINTVELFKGISDKNNVLTKMRISHILTSMGGFCQRSLINLTEHRDGIKIHRVKNEVAKQVEYAKQACEGIESMQKDFERQYK